VSLTVKSLPKNFLLAAIAASMLAACGPTNQETPQAQAPAPVVPAEQPATLEATEPTPPPPHPERLQGLNPQQVITLMGEPSLVRRDGSVQVMLFENETCVFEVVFREPSQHEYFQAHHYAARTLEGDASDALACLMKVLPNGAWPDK